MPRYYAADTAIKLFVWDPVSAVNNDHDGPSPETPALDEANQPLALEAPKARRAGRLPMRTKSQSTDPAHGCHVEELTEEFFEGQEGVDFLGHDMPFFLINSGQDLFMSSQPAAAQQELSHFRKSELRHSLLDLSGSSVPGDPTHANDADDESYLSSVSSSFSVPGVSNGPDPDISGTECASEPPRVLRARSSNVYNLEVYNESSNVVPMLLLRPKPMKIVVDLSQKSFIPSIFNNQMQELCINIFYNGELTHSRIIRPVGKRGPAETDKYQHYSGRRIDRDLEVPWVIRPDSLDDQSSPGPVEHCSFADRWDTINQRLLIEADAWGRQGKYRSPMGEYLVELSKRPVPHSIEHHQNAPRTRTGIIDVVIALGTSLAVNKWSIVLRGPRRKLHEDVCGKEKLHFVAPEQLRSRKKVQQMQQLELAEAGAGALTHKDSTLPEQITPSPCVSAQEQSLTIQGRSKGSGTVRASVTPGQVQSKLFSSNMPNATEGVNISAFPSAADARWKVADVVESAKGVADVAVSVDLTPITSETPTRTPGSSLSQLIQKAQPEILTPTTPIISRTGIDRPLTSSSPMTERQRRNDMKLTILSLPTGRGRLPDLKRPTSVPQKRFRGPDLDPASASSPKRAKMSNPLDFLPFDSEKPASFSTRSKRAAGSPIVATPESIRGEELVKGIQPSRRRRLDPQNFDVIPSSPIHLEVEQQHKDDVCCSASKTLQPPTAPLSGYQRNSGDVLIKESSARSDPADRDGSAVGPLTKPLKNSEAALEGILAIDCRPSEKLHLQGQKSRGSVETTDSLSKSKDLLQNPCKIAEENLQKKPDQNLPMDDNASSTETPRKIRRLVLVSTGKVAKSGCAGYSSNVDSLDSKPTIVPRNLRDRGNLRSTAKNSGNEKKLKARCDSTPKSIKANDVAEDGQTRKAATIKGLKRDSPQIIRTVGKTQEQTLDVARLATTPATGKQERSQSTVSSNGPDGDATATTSPFASGSGLKDGHGLDMTRAPCQTRSTKNGRPSNDALLAPSHTTSIPVSLENIKTRVRNCPKPEKKSMSGRELLGLEEPPKLSMGIDTATMSFSQATNGTRSSRNSKTKCKTTQRDISGSISKRSKVVGSSAIYTASHNRAKDTQKMTHDPTTKLDATNHVATAKSRRVSRNIVQPPEVVKTPTRGQPSSNTQANIPSTRNRHKPSTASNLAVVSTLNCNTGIRSPASELKEQATPPHPQNPVVATDESPIPVSNLWKPNHICEDSVLTYAGTEGWNGVKYNPTFGNVCRTIRSEREGVFRASGILMGVRFVVGR